MNTLIGAAEVAKRLIATALAVGSLAVLTDGCSANKDKVAATPPIPALTDGYEPGSQHHVRNTCNTGECAVNVYDRPRYFQSFRIGNLNEGQEVYIECQTSGDSFGENAGDDQGHEYSFGQSKVWDRIAVLPGLTEGYVTDIFVDTTKPVIGHGFFGLVTGFDSSIPPC